MIQAGPFMINWHGALTAAGILVSLVVARSMAKRQGLNPEEVIWLAPSLIIAALAGGRVTYVLSHPAEFTRNLWEIVRIDHGGLASHGALLFGVVAVCVYAWRHRVSAGRLLDALALAVPINYVAMRIGNFLTSELYGDPTTLPWGVLDPRSGTLRYPAQLYDAAGQTVVLILLTFWALRPQRPGQLAWLTLLGTSAVRLMSDSFRTELRVLGPLTLVQIGALVTSAVALAAWHWGRRDATYKEHAFALLHGQPLARTGGEADLAENLDQGLS